MPKKQKTGGATSSRDDGAELDDGHESALIHSKPASKAPVPDGPPPTGVFLQEKTGIAEDESYGDDEKALNTFLKLHPMLSMEASSVKTLASVANLFNKAAIHIAELPMVTKKSDFLLRKDT